MAPKSVSVGVTELSTPALQGTEQAAEGPQSPQAALGTSSSKLHSTGTMLPYSNTLFDGSQPEDSTRPRYVGSLTARHDPALRAALAGSEGGSISSSSGSHPEPAGGCMQQDSLGSSATWPAMLCICIFAPLDCRICCVSILGITAGDGHAGPAVASCCTLNAR